MRLSMTDQTRFLCERFAADVANVRSDAGVDEQVLFQGCFACEGFVANGADVRPIASVNSHMNL